MLFQSNTRRQKQIRKKTRDVDEDTENQSINPIEDDIKPMNIEPITVNNDNNSNSNDDVPLKPTTTIKKPTKKKQLSTLRSFDDEEEVEQDNIKSYSLENQTLKKSAFKQRSHLTLNSTHSSPVGEYTSEKLDLLRKDTSKRVTNNNDTESNEDIVLNDNEDQQQSSLPTLEQIKAAKEKRQRIREGHFNGDNDSNNDFIPLSTTDTRKNQEKVNTEDDEEDENLDTINTSKKDKNRIHFGDPGKSSSTSKIDKDSDQYNKTISTGSNTTSTKTHSILLNQQDDELDEEDEELQRWQFNLIKKGGGMKEDVTIDSHFRKHQQELLNTTTTAKQSIINITKDQISGGSFIDSVCKDMQLALETLEEVHSTHKSEFTRVEQALQDSKELLLDMESKQHVNDDEIGFFYEFQGFINNMADCLGEKIPLIEDYEHRLIDLERDHASALRKQINDYIKDIMEKIDSNNSTTNNNNSDEVDEFGRDRSYYEKSSREKRISLVESKRKQKRINNDNNMDVDDNNNYLDDISDEEDLFDSDEESYYRNEKEKTIDSIHGVLDDVDEDYSNLKNISERFQHWKSKDYNSYRKVHISYILPAIFAPFIRLQLINWNPFGNINFDTLDWYKDLSEYGLLNNTELDKDDPDHNLIPNLVIKLVIPRVEDYITFIWNPLSRVQTNNLKTTIEEIQIYLEDLGDLLGISNQLFVSLKHTADTLIFPLIKKEETLTKELTSFSDYMFKRCKRLLEAINICSRWIDKDIITRLCVDDLFNSKLIPFVSIQPNTKKEQYVKEIFECLNDNLLKKLDYSKEKFIVGLFNY